MNLLSLPICLLCCWLSLFGLLPAATAAPLPEPPAGPATYRIGPGDLLAIQIWKNEDLSKILPVLPDGTLSLPLTGEIIVAGKTVAQVTTELEKRLHRYMPEPVLTVSVQQVNSMLVYVLGRVNGPGMFNLNSKTNLLQVLAMAGGLTPFAERDGIKVFRQEKDGTTTIIPFDYNAVSEGEKLEQNILLHRGDVVVVP